jgi:molybdopterin-biosynthesis enzyme MoeA-like protein
MQSMFEALAPSLEGGPPIASRTVHADGVMEGRIAEGLAEIQRRWPDLDIGSYPYYRMGGGGVAPVAKGQDSEAVEEAARAITVLLRATGGKPVAGEPPQ